MLNRKIVLLLLISKVIAKVQIFITDSPIVQFGERVYKKELLTEAYKGPDELAYDSFSKNLFFTYMDDEIQNSARARLNVVSKKVVKIKGIKYNKAIAVDKDTGEVYFGSDNGLYKYNRETDEGINIALYNVNILKLVIQSNEMYLIDANNHMLYKVYDEGGIIVKIGNWKTVINFDVDHNKNIHFVTICGVYCAKNGHEIIKNKDLSMVYNFMVDGNITYGITEDSIYDINCYNGTARKVNSLTFIPRSIVLGNNGEIYISLDDSIFRLKPINSYFIYNLHKRNPPKL